MENVHDSSTWVFTITFFKVVIRLSTAMPASCSQSILFVLWDNYYCMFVKKLPVCAIG